MGFYTSTFRKHICSECGEEKLHGAVCRIKGEQCMRWICSECMEKIEKRGEHDADSKAD